MDNAPDAANLTRAHALTLKAAAWLAGNADLTRSEMAVMALAAYTLTMDGLTLEDRILYASHAAEVLMANATGTAVGA